MDYLISLISVFGHWGYLLLFLVIFLESFPVTFFLPGDSLLFTTGFLASSGQFNIGLLFLVFFTASFLGYIGSFYGGRKFKEIVFDGTERKWLNPKHVYETHKFFDKYGTKTIVIGRFVPVVRSFAPFVAGAVDMNYKKFLRYSFAGAIFWTGGITLAGFYLGRSFPGLQLHLTPIILAVVFVSILPAIVEYILNKRKKNASV